MKIFLFKSSLWLPAPRDEVFPFFVDVENLQRITPPWLHLRVLGSNKPKVEAGMRIDYKLRLHGFPIRWQSEIVAWEPPFRFVDEQRRGPYRLWVHHHQFTEEGGGTMVDDLVRYAVLGGRTVNRWLVRPDLEKIFTYRSEALAELFGARVNPAEIEVQEP